MPEAHPIHGMPAEERDRENREARSAGIGPGARLAALVIRGDQRFRKIRLFGKSLPAVLASRTKNALLLWSRRRYSNAWPDMLAFRLLLRDLPTDPCKRSANVRLMRRDVLEGPIQNPGFHPYPSVVQVQGVVEKRHESCTVDGKCAVKVLRVESRCKRITSPVCPCD